MSQHHWWLIVADYPHCVSEGSDTEVYTFFGNERSLKRIYSKKLVLWSKSIENIRRGTPSVNFVIFSLSPEGEKIRRPDLEKSIFGIESLFLPEPIKH